MGRFGSLGTIVIFDVGGPLAASLLSFPQVKHTHQEVRQDPRSGRHRVCVPGD